MKNLFILAVAIFLSCSFLPRNGECAEVTSLVFSITSSAVTSTANLRICPMKPKMLSMSGAFAQGFALDDSTIMNYFLTKSTTVTIDPSWGAIWIQTDQDTNMKKNSQSTFMKIYSGADKTFVLK